MATTVTKPVKESAMLRARARVNPHLAQELRDEIANFSALRRRCELQLAGDLKIPTRATPAKIRAHIAEIDSDLAELRQQLAAL